MRELLTAIAREIEEMRANVNTDAVVSRRRIAAGWQQCDSVLSGSELVRRAQAFASVMGAKRAAIYGGTFDPVHNGHLEVARRVQKLFGLDELFFVPACVPPHKRGRRYQFRVSPVCDAGAGDAEG